jgi:hypothetical protein
LKKLFLTLALIAGIAGFASSPASAQIYVRVGPPAPRYERQPSRPGPGYSWRAGYWGWQGGRWTWITGVWLGGHNGCTWVPAHWSHGYWRDGHWRC